MAKIKTDSCPKYPYGHNPPQEILEKVQELHTCESDISHLEQRLGMLQEQRRRLSDELAAFRASVAPISLIPVEILYMIINAVVGNGDYFQILQLSLVCKAWRNAVVNIPWLWVTLPITLVYDMDFMIKQQRLVEMVMDRSKGYLLDVSIDLTSSEPLQEYVSSRIELAFPSFYESADTVDWIAASDWNNLPAVEAIKESHRRLFDTIVGLEHENMARWRSLEIALPWEERDLEVVIPILKTIFDTPTSGLLELEINGHPSALEETGLQGLIMPSFKALQHLKCAAQFDLSNLNVSPTNLQFLDCVDAIMYRNLQHLNAFQDLRTLIYKVYLVMSPPVDLERILLPKLQRLHLSGTPHKEVLDLFLVPALLELGVTFHKEGYVDGMVPQSDIFAVPPAIIWRGDDSCPMNGEIQRSLIQQCKSAAEITVEDSWKEEMATVILEYRQENPGELALLRTVFGCNELGEVMEFPIDVSVEPP